MTIPTLLDYPLHAAPIAEERLPLRGADPAPLLLALVKQSFELIRSSEAWRKGKAYGSPDEPLKGGKILTLSCPSDMEGRLKKCAWHARFSQHKPEECKLDFDEFFDGLGSEDHTPNEGEYVPDIVETLKIDTIVPGRAEIWRNSYHLGGPLISNRDFLELVVTIPLPPSPAPFSRAHEEVVTRQIATAHRLASDPGAPSRGRRSFVVISVPVSHHAAPERNEFVRAKYASVEGVWEGQSTQSGERPQVEWFMAVQSDTAGKVPLMFQEMAMADKIRQDVPLFFDWLRNRRDKSGKKPAHTSRAQGSAMPTHRGDNSHLESANTSVKGGSTRPESRVDSHAAPESSVTSVGAAAPVTTAATSSDQHAPQYPAYRDQNAQHEQNGTYIPQHQSNQNYPARNGYEGHYPSQHEIGNAFASTGNEYPSTSGGPSAMPSEATHAESTAPASNGVSSPQPSAEQHTSGSGAAPPLSSNYLMGGGNAANHGSTGEQYSEGHNGSANGGWEASSGTYGDGTAPSLEEQMARQAQEYSTSHQQ